MGLSSPPNRERDARDENDLLRRLLRLAKAQGKETPGKRYSDHTLAEKIKAEANGIILLDIFYSLL